MKIDAEAARKAPGEVAIYSWADMEKEGSGYFVSPAMFPNADKKPRRRAARWARGRALCRRAGRGGRGRRAREQAADAAALVEVEEQLPSVTEIDAGRRAAGSAGAPGNRVGFNRFASTMRGTREWKTTFVTLLLRLLSSM